MNDVEVSKQVYQMVQFIRQEAEEKANEISVAAEEEFNIEKLQLLEADKRKIRQEYERKEKQVEIAKKIEYSKQLNASRLKVLQAQDSIIKAIKDEVQKKLYSVADDKESYRTLLKDLVLQGLVRLSEPSVLLRCRKEDLSLVQAVVSESQASYAEVTGKRGVPIPQVHIDTSTFLPPGPQCPGGVLMASRDGRIVCANTLDARLEIAFKQNLPAIRSSLFKTSVVS